MIYINIYSDPEEEKVAAVCSLQHSSEHVHDRLTLPPASMKQHAKVGLYLDTQDFWTLVTVSHTLTRSSLRLPFDPSWSTSYPIFHANPVTNNLARRYQVAGQCTSNYFYFYLWGEKVYRGQVMMIHNIHFACSIKIWSLSSQWRVSKQQTTDVLLHLLAVETKSASCEDVGCQVSPNLFTI